MSAIPTPPTDEARAAALEQAAWHRAEAAALPIGDAEREVHFVRADVLVALSDPNVRHAMERVVPPLDVDGQAKFEALVAGEDAAQLLEAVKVALERYVVFSGEHQVVAVAAWVLHTYIVEAFDVTPYLHVHSVTKQSGKTRLFEVLVLLVAKPWMTGGVSAAALFRKIERLRPTLLLDEVDTLFGDDPEMTSSIRGILNTGYSRSGVFTRCVGQGQNIEEKDFATFCPKAFAGIGDKLPDTVRDRSIPVALRRRSPTERPPGRFRQARATAELAPLAAQLRAWGRAHVETIGAWEHQEIKGLSDRQEDIWQPLLAIAALAGGDWPSQVERAALALHEGAEDGDNTTLLLAHAREAFDDLGDRLSSLQLLEHLVNRGDASPWVKWWGEDVERGDARLKTAAQSVARKLRPMGIKPEKIRFGDTTRQGYHRDDFEDAWARYLPRSDLPGDLVGTSEHPCSGALFGSNGSDPKIGSDLRCSDVPTSGPEESERGGSGDIPTGLDGQELDVMESVADPFHCVYCGAEAVPAPGSVERGWATVCRECSAAGR